MSHNWLIILLLLFVGSLPARAEQREASVTVAEADAGNFFMLPQQLEGAEMRVTFTTPNGATTVYSAPLSGKWIQGQHVAYTIRLQQDISVEAITGDYIDAHYDRFAVRITPNDLGSTTTWSVASTLADVTMLTQSDYTSNDDYKLLREGYWTDKFTNGTSARGTAALSFTGNDPQTIWVFVPENVGTFEREIPLTITVDSRVVHTDRSVKQHCPVWDKAGTFGAEHFDTSDGIVWGFSWSGSETYTSNDPTGLLHWLDRYVYNSLSELISGLSYISSVVKKFGVIGNTYYYESISIHYDQIKLENAADSDSDGKQNTSDIYNFKGFGDLSTVVTTLQNNGYVSDGGGGSAINPSNSAAIAVLKHCNKWNVQKESTNQGNGYTIQFLGIDWYLPAKDQCTASTFAGATGIYWTSTASTGSNVLSDTYMAPDGIIGSADRQSLHKVKAFRNKPSTQ